MNILLKIALLFPSLALTLNGFSADSTRIFGYNTFLEIVRDHHPIAYQAQLRADAGVQKLKKAKGGFDPKLEGNARQKYFDQKQYYSYINAGLKVPTWFGISAQAGYDNNNGERLNPESYTDPQGLWHAGLTANLGKGLFIDERRAELAQGKIYLESSLVEQQLMLNQLLLDASETYWDWYKAYNKVRIYEEALQNAQFRLEGVKESVMLGDKAAVDTLKAKILVQDRELKLVGYLMDLQIKQRKMEVFLWEDGMIPLELDSTLIPEGFRTLTPNSPEFQLPLSIDTLVDNHPEIQMANYGIALSKIDFRLKREALKPTVELKYNALNSGDVESYNVENYQWGLHFAYPIFTRKERGNMRLAEIKLQESEAKLQNKNAEVKYKILAAYEVWKGTALQSIIYRDAVENYGTLLRAEEQLFRIGESSLFLVNIRDQDWIDAQIKLIDILYLNQMAIANYNYQTVNF